MCVVVWLGSFVYYDYLRKRVVRVVIILKVVIRCGRGKESFRGFVFIVK